MTAQKDSTKRQQKISPHERQGTRHYGRHRRIQRRERRFECVVRSWPMILGLLTDSSDLSEADSRWAMGEIMSDNATSAQIAAFGSV